MANTYIYQKKLRQRIYPTQTEDFDRLNLLEEDLSKADVLAFQNLTELPRVLEEYTDITRPDTLAFQNLTELPRVLEEYTDIVRPDATSFINLTELPRVVEEMIDVTTVSTGPIFVQSLATPSRPD